MALRIGPSTPAKLYLGSTEVTKAYLEASEAYSSASSAWTPAELGASLALWLDADDAETITLNGSTVSQWDDKSGNDRHASQATAANQPNYTASGLNGKPVLTFNGSPDSLNFQGVHDAQWSLAVVGQASGSNQAFIQFGGTNQFGSLFLEAGAYRARPVGSISASAPFTPAEQVIITATYDVATTDIWKNGTIGTQGAMGGVSSNASSVLGSLHNIYNLNGFMGEVVVSNGVLSTADRQKLEGYLAWKWGGV